jgi:hypothetical protein
MGNHAGLRLFLVLQIWTALFAAADQASLARWRQFANAGVT